MVRKRSHGWFSDEKNNPSMEFGISLSESLFQSGKIIPIVSPLFFQGPQSAGANNSWVKVKVRLDPGHQSPVNHRATQGDTESFTLITRVA